GLQEGGVSATLKHFPGMGTVTSDTHDGTATSGATYEELVATDFLPFISGITAGTDFVMVGHQTMTNLPDGDIPACLSSYIVTDLLRGELGYDGIVITDAMNMDAIDMTSGEATIAALEAGVDMILMPDDIDEAYTALVDAINEGTLTEARINESLYRILKVKIDNGLLD
ncbi:MAG: glycoside hydrolase family 3 N-terminal domain-containing protein, partial [Eubacteriales bacterium]